MIHGACVRVEAGPAIRAVPGAALALVSCRRRRQVDTDRCRVSTAAAGIRGARVRVDAGAVGAAAEAVPAAARAAVARRRCRLVGTRRCRVSASAAGIRDACVRIEAGAAAEAVPAAARAVIACRRRQVIDTNRARAPRTRRNCSGGIRSDRHGPRGPGAGASGVAAVACIRGRRWAGRHAGVPGWEPVPWRRSHACGSCCGGAGRARSARVKEPGLARVGEHEARSAGPTLLRNEPLRLSRDPLRAGQMRHPWLLLGVSIELLHVSDHSRLRGPHDRGPARGGHGNDL